MALSLGFTEEIRHFNGDWRAVSRNSTEGIFYLPIIVMLRKPLIVSDIHTK
jgi:hypothetical protein